MGSMDGFSSCDSSISESCSLQRIAASAPETLEHFTVLMYQRNSPYAGVNEAREKLFSKGNRSIENIPPHQMHSINLCYEQHTKGHSCGASAWRKKPLLPSPSSWGWKKGEQYWQPVWMTHSQAQDACYELIRCGCKKGCRGRYKCAAVRLQCTALYSCGGDCSQD